MTACDATAVHKEGVYRDGRRIGCGEDRVRACMSAYDTRAASRKKECNPLCRCVSDPGTDCIQGLGDQLVGIHPKVPGSA